MSWAIAGIPDGRAGVHLPMTTTKQRQAAKKNVRKAAKAARSKRTISKLSRKTRTALGKEGAKARRR